MGFFAYLFKSSGYIRALQATADFIRDGQDLNFDNFCRVDLPVLPIDEQKAIAKSIGRRASGIETSISRCYRGISLLGEYRTRLIADVVTGKLDVREAAARLPEEAEEPEPVEEIGEPGDPEAPGDDEVEAEVEEESL